MPQLSLFLSDTLPPPPCRGTEISLPIRLGGCSVTAPPATEYVCRRLVAAAANAAARLSAACSIRTDTVRDRWEVGIAAHLDLARTAGCVAACRL